MSRDLQVKVMLNPEEFVAFRALADDAWQSQSGLARQLIRQAIREFAESSGEATTGATDEPVHNKAKS